MTKFHTFKFSDEELNRDLIGLLNGAKIDYSVDDGGVIHYSAADQEVVENELIGSIRDKVFPSWQILTAPPEWISFYRDYMERRDIPFQEEWSDGESWFLIPRKHRPHSWKLASPIKLDRLAESEA